MANDLLDSIEVEFTIECSACGMVGDSNERASAEAAASGFEASGWKRDEDGEVRCPECWASA